MVEEEVLPVTGVLSKMLSIASLMLMGLCASCGPGLESEADGQRASCLSSSSLAQSDGADGVHPVAESLEACNQRMSSVDTTETHTAEQ